MSPRLLLIFIVLCSVGRRKSVSASTTRRPDSLRARPRLATTVDLPSSAKALVTSRRFSGSPRVLSSMPTRSALKASVNMSWSLGPWPFSGTPLMNIGRPPRMRGMRARTGNPVARSTSSSFSIFRWSHSTAAGTAAPTPRAAAKAMARAIIRFSLPAGTGEDAGSMTLTTFISPCSRIRAAVSFSESMVYRPRWLSTSRDRRAYSASPPESPFRLWRSTSACRCSASS